MESISDKDWREVVSCALTTYRLPNTLHVGDRLPAVTLRQLGSAEMVELNVPRDRPLVLLFGSFT